MRLTETIFVEDEAKSQPKPVVVRYVVRNPLCIKSWNQVLMEHEAKLKRAIGAWWMAWVRRLVPASVYDDIISKDETRFLKGAKYMAKHGIRFDNPNGRSLERHVYNEGRIVGVFSIELQEGST